MDTDLSRLLNPQSVAIVGVSENASRIGGRLLKYITKHGFTGRLALVNPKYTSLNGFDCFPSVSDIPFTPDCVLVAVPESMVLSVLEECVAASVKSAVVFSSGFAEMGSAGKEAQDRIKELSRTSGLQICGPNCIGVVNFNAGISLSFSQLLECDRLMPGRIGFVSQSGALGGSLVDRANGRGIGLSCFISSGNEASLEVSDYLSHLVLHDDETTVLAAVIEGLKDGRKFLEAAALAREHRKPLIVYKIGETDSGRKAAASHTGSMTGSDAVFEAVCKQNGIIRARNYDDLLETADLFAKGRIPKGRRVGILTSSGGAGIIMADQYAKLGLEVPEPSEKTKELAKGELSAFGHVSNPFDLTGQIFSDPEMFKRCMKLFVEDENFDIIQVNVSMVANEASTRRASMLLESIGDSPKPVVSWWAAGSLSDPGVRALNGSQVAAFRAPERCASALRELVRYREDLSGAARGAPIRSDSGGSREAIKELLLNVEDRSLSEHASKALLSAYGIPVTRERVATAREEAAEIAREMGFPVVLKISSPDIQHKTEANAILVGVRSQEEVLTGYDQVVRNAMRHSPGARIEGVLVQEMLQDGIEVMVGVSEDPQFGPTVAFGLGGIFVEVLRDISMRVAPLSRLDAERMIEETRAAKLLAGARGRKRADVDALVDVLLRISQLALEHADRISEIDVNPLIVFEEGKGVRALDALVVFK